MCIQSSLLYRWFGKNGTVPRETRSLVPVRITTATVEPEHGRCLEVGLQNGRIVRVLGGFDEEILHRLVEVLERC